MWQKATRPITTLLRDPVDVQRFGDLEIARPPSPAEASLGPRRCMAGLGASEQGAGGWASVRARPRGSRLRRDERTLVAWRSGWSR